MFKLKILFIFMKGARCRWCLGLLLKSSELFLASSSYFFMQIHQSTKNFIVPHLTNIAYYGQQTELA